MKNWLPFFCILLVKYLFMKGRKKERKSKNTERENLICSSSSKWTKWSRLVHTEARIQAFHVGSRHPSPWGHLCCIPKDINWGLDWKWSSLESPRLLKCKDCRQQLNLNHNTRISAFILTPSLKSPTLQTNITTPYQKRIHQKVHAKPN